MFRRGFKSWCEETAVKVRTNQNLTPTSPLSALVLARELRVEVLPPSELRYLAPDVIRRLTREHADCWSAITIPGKRSTLIVYNPAHSEARQNSDLMHELAHIFLGHKPTFVFIDPQTGLAIREHDKPQEEEAAWLSGCLLLPRVILTHIKSSRMQHDLACRHYCVSQQMLSYRMNVSGVNLQHSRTQARRKGSAR
jgi:hypothetical protein